MEQINHGDFVKLKLVRTLKFIIKSLGLAASLSLGSSAFAQYPSAVSALSWGPSVWDLKLPGAVGPKTAPQKVVGKDVLPACATYDSNYVYVKCAMTLDGWDFFASRHAVIIDAPNVVIRNSKFGHANVGYPLYVGQNNVAGTSATIDHCILDGTNGDDRFGGLIHVTNNAIATMTYTHIFNSRMAAAIVTYGGRLVAEHNWWGAAPVDGPPGTHGESSHPMGGSSVFRDNLFDQTDGVNRIQGFSAILFIEGISPISEILIERNILYGMKAINGYYAIGSSKSVASVRIRDNLIESGINGAHTYPGLVGLVEFARNFDFDSGRALLYSADRGAYIASGTTAPPPASEVAQPQPVPVPQPLPQPPLVTTPQTDRVAPSVRITSPSSRRTISVGRTRILKVETSDNVGVKGVNFYVNDRLTCQATVSPFQCPTNFPRAGVYLIQAKAFDAARNVGQSEVVKLNAR